MTKIVKLYKFDCSQFKSSHLAIQVQRVFNLIFQYSEINFFRLVGRTDFQVVVDSLNDFMLEFQDYGQLSYEQRRELFYDIIGKNFEEFSRKQHKEYLERSLEVQKLLGLQETTGGVFSYAIQPRDGSISLNSDENPPKARKRLRKQPIEK